MNILNFTCPTAAAQEILRVAYKGKWFKTVLRETLQNSADAKASEIFYNVSRHETYTGERFSKFEVFDNGIGMNEDTIMNAFLTLGGSKKDKGATGGFGIAKFLILWSTAESHGIGWQVQTRTKDGKTLYFNDKMIGKESVKVVDDEFEQGTRITIYRKEYLDDDDAIDFLVYSGIKASIYYNSEEVQQLKRARKIGQCDFADIFAKKSCLTQMKNKYVVRINGVPQLVGRITHRWDALKLPGVAILELKVDHRPKDEKYPLNLTRDVLKDSYVGQFNTIIESMLEQEQQQNKNIDPWVIDIWENEDYHDSVQETNILAEDIHSSQIKMANVDQKQIEKEREEVQDMMTNKTSTEDVAEETESYRRWREKQSYLAMKKRQQEEMFTKIARAASGLNEQVEQRVAGLNCLSEEEVGRLTFMKRDGKIGSFDKIMIKRRQGCKKTIQLGHVKNVKVLSAWNAVIRMVMAVSGFVFDYKVGWIINDESEDGCFAEYFYTNGERYLLLNPKNIKVSSIPQLTLTLVQRAVHEIAHKRVDGHYEDFTKLYHHLMESAVNYRFNLYSDVVRSIMRAK